MTFRAALGFHFDSFHIIYIMRYLESQGLLNGLTGEPRQTGILSNYDMAWFGFATNQPKTQEFFSANPIGG